MKEWLKIIGLAFLLGVILAGYGIAIAHAEQFTSSNDRKNVNVILQGNWQSCRETHGAPTNLDNWSEQVYEHVVWSFDHAGSHSRLDWQLHLGPKDEFAVFPGETADHPDHASQANLLYPAYKYGNVQTVIGGRTWNFTSSGKLYRFNAVVAGGSRDDCESYWILLERLP